MAAVRESPDRNPVDGGMSNRCFAAIDGSVRIPQIALRPTLKIGHAVLRDSTFGAGTTVFCDEIEQGTQGRFKCQQFAGGALGGAREMIEAVQLGTLRGHEHARAVPMAKASARP